MICLRALFTASRSGALMKMKDGRYAVGSTHGEKTAYGTYDTREDAGFVASRMVRDITAVVADRGRSTSRT